jgi:hypothetical protein
MAGNIFIQNITSKELAVLTAAGAIMDTRIYHANRSWANFQARLTAQLQTGAQNNRVNLPAHMYVTFNANDATRNTLRKYLDIAVQKQSLKAVLDRTWRPLGVVSNQPYLEGWPNNVPPGGSPGPSTDRLLSVITNDGPVIIEFYQVDGTPVLQKYPGMATVDE